MGHINIQMYMFEPELEEEPGTEEEPVVYKLTFHRKLHQTATAPFRSA